MLTATDEAAEDGTACQDGMEPAPVEVKTHPVLDDVGNFANVLPAPTSKSPVV